MILSDGKHIQGIFIYDPDVEFERGDFIIEDECIYLCKSGNPVKGLVPSENPDFYSPYPGSMITSIEEYSDYIANPVSKEDKYISSNILMGILQDMYFGFGDSGVIESYIALKEDGTYNIDTQLLNLIGKNVDKIETPLDLLMREPSVNNAYVQVDRNLLDIKYLLTETDSVTKRPCLLRQYTYRDLNDLAGNEDSGVFIEIRYRVQELVDLETSMIYYRWTKGSRNFTGNSDWVYEEPISNWSCTCVSKDLLNKMNQINNYYNNSRIIEEETNTQAGETIISTVEVGLKDMNNLTSEKLKLDSSTREFCTLIQESSEPSSYEFPCITLVDSFVDCDELFLNIGVGVLFESEAVYYSKIFDAMESKSGEHEYILDEDMDVRLIVSEYSDIDNSIKLSIVIGGPASVVQITNVNQISYEKAHVEKVIKIDYPEFVFMELPLYTGTTNHCTLIQAGDNTEYGSDVYPCRTPLVSFADSDDFLITVVLQICLNESRALYKSYSCTFDALESKNEAEYYYLDEVNKICLCINYISAEGREPVIELSVVDSETKDPISDAKIVSLRGKK